MSENRKVILSLLVASSVPGCYPASDPGAQTESLRVVETIDVRRSAASDVLNLIGRIEPWREATLYFEVAGVVAEVLVEEGDLVKPEQPIARLELVDFQLALSRVRSEYKAALANLNLLEAGTRKEDLDAAQADLSRAQARTKFWTSEFQRTQRLHRQSGVVTESEYYRVRQEYDAALQSERLAKARLEKAVAGPRKEEIQAAAAEVDARKQAMAIAQRQLDKATLKSEFSGRIEKRLVDPGAYINVFPAGGVPVVHLVDLDTVDAVVAVPEQARSSFQVGDQLRIASAIRADIESAGEVISVGKIADRASGTYQVRVRIPNADGLFTGGMVVTATSTTSSGEPVIRIPVSAIRRAYGQLPHVLIVEVDGDTSKVVRREIELGSIRGDQVTVTRGLTGGELLIVRGQHLVVTGDMVRSRPLGDSTVAHKQDAAP